jgi:hypothetical protein
MIRNIVLRAGLRCRARVGHLQGSGLIYWLPPLPKLSRCMDP